MKKFKVAFNLEPVDGSFGGGNSFLDSLTNGFRGVDHEVYFDLSIEDLDFIFLIDPRWNHPLSTFNTRQISLYKLKNQRTLVVHRINECDERKNTNSINGKLRLANSLADCTVYVSDWLKTLNLQFRTASASDAYTLVIRNGSNEHLFTQDLSNVWKINEKMRIVTHHWSSNPMKGLPVYSKLNDLLSHSSWAKKIEFTYIGNPPVGSQLDKTKLIPALSGESLAKELRSHHVYVTGSVNEPGGNHQNEGMLSGLPTIFLRSGSMAEYCEGFGIGLDSVNDLEHGLEKMFNEYSVYRARLQNFPFTSKNMVGEYLNLLEKLDQDRERLIAKRRGKRLPLTISSRLFFPI